MIPSVFMSKPHNLTRNQKIAIAAIIVPALIVALGWFIERPPTNQTTNSTVTTGPASTSGLNSPANTGYGNSFHYENPATPNGQTPPKKREPK